jgi:hypothetical protein
MNGSRQNHIQNSEYDNQHNYKQVELVNTIKQIMLSVVYQTATILIISTMTVIITMTSITRIDSTYNTQLNYKTL